MPFYKPSWNFTNPVYTGINYVAIDFIPIVKMAVNNRDDG